MKYNTNERQIRENHVAAASSSIHYSLLMETAIKSMENINVPPARLFGDDSSKMCNMLRVAVRK